MTKRQSIADVFADFYADLYRRRPPDGDNHAADHRPTNNEAVQAFTSSELDAALQQLRTGRCPDTSGLKAEMLKNGGSTLRWHLLRLYNDILQPDSTPPADWKKSTITIIHKSGDPELPSNYRPISIIPLLYKLFARLLYNRLAKRLDEHQTPDQAGFRPDFSAADHLFTITILHEHAQEWQVPLWTAAVDFKKAFDSISHDRLWQTLQRQNIPQQYIRLLRCLYEDQTATVKTDTRSKPFHIERGVKQGDPLSSLLFNAVLEDIFQTLKTQWATRQYGVRLGHTKATCLTNLRFADDVLLVAGTLHQVTTMLADLRKAALPHGLELHPDKTYILSNLSQRRGRQTTTHVDIGGQHVKVIKYHDHTKYLGRKLTFNDYHLTEIDNRVSTAWRKFNALRSEFTNKRYPLRSRLRLFDATITPTALYACTSWTTTKELDTKLQRAQRRMLRLILGAPRRIIHHDHDVQDSTTTMEPWPESIIRSTHRVEAALHDLNIESWPTTYLRRKWRWAARIAQQDYMRWSRLVTTWRPELHHKLRTSRRVGHPHKRWDDDIESFLLSKLPHDAATTDWIHHATADNWPKLENDFVAYTTTLTTTSHTQWKHHSI